MVTPELDQVRDHIREQLKSLERNILEGKLPAPTDNAGVAEQYAAYRSAVVFRRSLYTLLDQIDDIAKKGEPADELVPMEEGK